MPALFDKGFFVREPAWHGLGVVLDDYPGREEAMRLAGHDWGIIVLNDLYARIPYSVLDADARAAAATRGSNMRRIEGRKVLLREDDLTFLNVAADSYEPIANATAYDVAELLFDQGFQYETGITLDGGRTCAITLKLDEPITITGDDSIILPFGCLSWAHDGSGALRVRSGTIRQVCANTVAASEAEGRRLGTDFTFRHTSKVQERLDDAKAAIRGVRDGLAVYREAAEELAAMAVTTEQRDWFVSTIVGDRDGSVSRAANVSERVRDNVETERAKVNALFMGPTIPESHELTAYGLFLAGGEYFDHCRNYRTPETYVRRTLLNTSPEKAALRKTITEALAIN